MLLYGIAFIAMLAFFILSHIFNFSQWLPGILSKSNNNNLIASILCIPSVWLMNYCVKQIDFDGFRNMLKQKTINRLKDNRLISADGVMQRDKMEYLIKLVRELSDSMKSPFFVSTGLFVAVVTPVWAMCVKWVYDNAVKTMSDAFIFLALVFFVLFVAYPFYSIFSFIRNFDYMKSRKLLDLLNEIYLERPPE